MHGGCRALSVIVMAWLVVMSFGLAEAAGQARSTTPRTPPVAAGPILTLERVQSKIHAIEARQDLEELLKNQLLELYRQAKGHLEVAQSHAASALSYQQAMQSAPAEIKRLHQTLEQEPGSAIPPTVADTPLPELEQQLLKAEADMAGVQSKQADLARLSQESQDRPAQARDELAAARQDLEEVNDLLKAHAAPQGSPLLAEAERLMLQARKQARMNEIHKLEQELLSHDLRLKRLIAQRDQSTQEVALAESRIRQIEELIAKRRQTEAEQAQIEAERAQLEAASKHPAIRKLAGQNAALSRELAAVIDGLGRATAKREATSKHLEQLEQDFQSARQKLEIAGLSQALGQILREQRRKLPELGRYDRDSRERQQAIAEVGLNQLRIEDSRRALRGIKRVLDRLMSAKDTTVLPPEQQQAIRADLRTLVKDQRRLLDRLADAYTSYLRALGDVDFVHKQLVDKAQQYALFLDERLLWIPSSRPVGFATVHNLALATAWMLSPLRWAQTSETLVAAALRAPIVIIPVLLLFGALFSIRRRARLTLEAIAERVSKPYSDRFILTAQALGLIVLVAAPWPIFLSFLGWRLQAPVEASAFSRTVGAALLQLAPALFLFYTFYLVCRPKGIAELHFGWQEQALTLFRRHLPWLMAIVLPAVFVTSMVGWEAEEAYRDSLGRLAFIISLLAFAVFLQRLLRPKGGALEAHLRRHPRGWLNRLRLLWYPLAIGLPLTLAGLAAAGYYYTALELETQLVATVWLIAGAVIAHDLVIRWLTLENRKLALIKAREKREAARAAEVVKAAAGASGEAAPEALDIPEIDLPTINLQTRHLLRTVIGVSVVVGLWLIWAEVLPALRILDQVSVWQYAVVTDGQEKLEPVTLANLAAALVLTIVAVVAAHNVPGVLEIAVLRRLSIEPGSRYAITQIARYFIAVIGVIAVFNAIGGQWSQVQWLVAALSVGLGFGLQEIFSNFVSGLILLFERPIRMGDVVTVGDLTGTVSRIRIRATTITDANKRELIVPNKILITDRIINWTLSDTTTRVVIPVSIAYGADAALAHRVILEAVHAHPLVMPDPEPAVAIVGFAEGAINFEVRVFVKELGHRAPVDHELRLRIHDALCTHHIQTPLPERNVHVRSFVSTLQAPNRRSEPPEGDRLPTFGPPARGEGK
jgi:potassium-dependent mechanosensitive channel